jgi:DNA recombination protein RmuC
MNEEYYLILSILQSGLLIGLLVFVFKSQQDQKQVIKYLNQIDDLRNAIKELNHTLDQSFKENRSEFTSAIKDNRTEMASSLNRFQLVVQRSILELNQLHSEKFDRLNTMLLQSLDHVRTQVETQLSLIQKDNNQRLEEMRMTVDEKLQASVEKRFTESFKLISERLDKVQQGLGEMQTLATGVGDLKKVLMNVKTRGNLGEIQLKNILEQVLSRNQYIENASVNHTADRVEFAIKLPGQGDEDHPLLLPIDSKFPIEDYQRLLDAYENNTAVDQAVKSFETAVKKNAKDIHSKYINPPITTDFAIMFVPTEGLYAEILRINGLFEQLQRDMKITIVGPSNLVAFLSSLQMGFKTLAIEKRSSEVWQLLGSIKHEFSQFGTILDHTKKKLQEATNVIDKANTRTRVIQRKLKDVESLETTVPYEIEDLDEPDELV